MFGPFKIKVSTTALRLSLNDLSQDEQERLCAKTRFDAATHDVYRFSVIPEFTMNEEEHGLFSRWSRKTKKESFSKADNVLIQVRVGSPEISLYGIHPITMTVDGQPAHEYELSGGLEAGIPGTGSKAKIEGKLKNILNKKVLAVWADSIDNFAQWVFLKGWLETNPSFRLEILCSVPKSLDQASRFITCDVRVAEGNRTIKRATKKRVLLPGPNNE